MTETQAAQDKRRTNELLDSLHEAQQAKNEYEVSLDDFNLLLKAYNDNLNWIRIGEISIENVASNHRHYANAIITRVNFTNSAMRHCHFNSAILCSSTFTNVDFFDSIFTKTDLEGVEFINCDLSDCYFVQADLSNTKGLKTVFPVGSHGRLIYAYVLDGEIRIQAGCRNETPTEIRDAINYSYEDDPVNKADYLGAVKYIEQWGKAEIKRLKARAKVK